MKKKRISKVKISNKLFDFKCRPAVKHVYAYLCTILGKKTKAGTMVRVRQKTIAARCRICKEETVSRIIDELLEMGLIAKIIKTTYRSGKYGTYNYIIKPLSLDEGYFYVDRINFFGRFTSKQMLVYLFICKSYDVEKRYCWNSYTDISNALNIRRSEAIKIIAFLYLKHYITKQHTRNKKNSRAFDDNIYSVIKLIDTIGFAKKACRFMSVKENTKKWFEFLIHIQFYSIFSRVQNRRSLYYPLLN